MVENSKFNELLDKHHLSHNTSAEARVQVAVRILSMNPSNLDMYLLALGNVPETYEQFQSVMDFVKTEINKPDKGSLESALMILAKKGESIYIKDK